MAPWTLKSGGDTIFTMPKAAVWRSFVMNHLVHHRAQLSVYLRMQDVPLPVDVRTERRRGSRCLTRAALALHAGRLRWLAGGRPVRPRRHRQRRRLPLRRLRPGVLHSGRRPRARPRRLSARRRAHRRAGRADALRRDARRLVRATGLSLESLFLAGYLLSLALLVWGGLRPDRLARLRQPWATAALGAAFTLRHRIPRTSANSFEPYFHPRMLAFGVGAAGDGRRAPPPVVAGRGARGRRRRGPRHDGAVVRGADRRGARHPRSPVADCPAGRRGRRAAAAAVGARHRAAARPLAHDGRRVAAGGRQQGLALRHRSGRSGRGRPISAFVARALAGPHRRRRAGRGHARGRGARLGRDGARRPLPGDAAAVVAWRRAVGAAPDSARLLAGRLRGDGLRRWRAGRGIPGHADASPWRWPSC